MFDVKAFQLHESVHDWRGHTLAADGQLGPRTLWALAVADLPRWRRELLSEACSREGTTEAPPGSNSGPAITLWLRAVGAKAGDPWCAAFVYSCLTKAGLDAVKTASARECLAQFPMTHTPRPGDLFGWVNPDGTGHVGFVIGFTAEGVATLEGNSNDGVRVCSRPIVGLEFREVRGPAYYAELCPVVGAPVVVRATAGTR